jgi:hypothetical protein
MEAAHCKLQGSVWQPEAGVSVFKEGAYPEGGSAGCIDFRLSAMSSCEGIGL